MPPRGRSLLPAGHRLLAKPDREGLPTCLPMQAQTPYPSPPHTHPAHNQSRRCRASQPGAQFTAPLLHCTRAACTLTNTTHPSHKHTPSHTLMHTLSLTQNPPITHSHIQAHTYIHSLVLTNIHAHAHSHTFPLGQVPVPKSHIAPSLPHCLSTPTTEF